jgi:hypothetical protein
MRMRYLCGHGRALSWDFAEIGSGIVAGVAVDAGSADALSSGGCDGAIRGRNGVSLVGPGLTNSVMSSGMFAAVTLSMNCHDGSSSTIELWSEWSGTGMLEADSISF